MNLGGGSCGEPRLCQCTLAWATEQDSISKEKKNAYNGGTGEGLINSVPASGKAALGRRCLSWNSASVEEMCSCREVGISSGTGAEIHGPPGEH